MQVKNIKIENYKGILDAEVSFHERLNVFVGNNGAGKTTLLDAIVINMNRLTFDIARMQKKLVLIFDDVKIKNH